MYFTLSRLVLFSKEAKSQGSVGALGAPLTPRPKLVRPSPASALVDPARSPISAKARFTGLTVAVGVGPTRQCWRPSRSPAFRVGLPSPVSMALIVLPSPSL